MNSVFKFLLKSLKTMLLSPFYLLYFIICVFMSLKTYIWGEIKFIISGFKYGKDQENKYYKKLKSKTESDGGIL